MAKLKLVQVCRIEVEVTVDQRDARKSALAPTVIDEAAALLRDRLPVPSKVTISPISIVRRRVGEGDEKVGRDQRASDADIALTPLEEFIAKTPAQHPPEETLVTFGGQEVWMGDLVPGGLPAEDLGAVVGDSEIFAGVDVAVGPEGELIPIDPADTQDGWGMPVDGPDEVFPIAHEGPEFDDLPPREVDPTFDRMVAGAAEEEYPDAGPSEDGDERMGEDEDPVTPAQPARGAVYSVGENGTLIPR